MTKSRLSIFLIALMVSLVFLFGTIHLGNAQSGTNVIGIITSDTTWTQANSPYSFSGNVLVSAGTILTIEPGVTVYLNDFYLKVDGTLIARGTSANQISFIRSSTVFGGITQDSAIQFTSNSVGWNENTKSGSILENAIVNSSLLFSSTIYIGGSSPKINNCTIVNTGGQSSVDISGGTPTISNNTILTYDKAGYTGIKVGSNALITDNIVNGWETGIYVTAGNGTIQNNLIINNTGSITNGNAGIRVDKVLGNNNPLIQNNTLTLNNAGFYFGGSPTPTIANNNIARNNQYNLVLSSSNDASVTNNWWGTPDTTAIYQTIFDFKNDFNLGTVTFTPFLSAPNIQAPTYISASAGNSGSIAPIGIIKANYGSSQSFSITSNTGYHVADVLVNGTSVGAVSSYTVQNVQGATTISATFAPNPTPTPTPSPSPIPTASPTQTPTQTPSPTATSTPNPTSQPTQQPTASPSPTPAVPEFPAWTTLLLFTIVVATAGLLICHKKHWRAFVEDARM